MSEFTMFVPPSVGTVLARIFVFTLVASIVGIVVAYGSVTILRAEPVGYVCSVHGVEYIQTYRGLALSVDGNGYPVGCKP